MSARFALALVAVAVLAPAAGAIYNPVQLVYGIQYNTWCGTTGNGGGCTFVCDHDVRLHVQVSSGGHAHGVASCSGIDVECSGWERCAETSRAYTGFEGRGTCRVYGEGPRIEGRCAAYCVSATFPRLCVDAAPRAVSEVQDLERMPLPVPPLPIPSPFARLDPLALTEVRFTVVADGASGVACGIDGACTAIVPACAPRGQGRECRV